MNNFEILFNLIVHPLYALRREDRSLGLAVVVVIAALWSSIAGNYLIRGNPVNTTFFSFNIIFSVITMLFFIVLQVSLWHFISESFKGKGKVSELFLCVCLSFLPFIFFAPMALIMNFLSINTTFFWLFFRFFIFVWVAVLQIYSIRVVYELNGPQAVLTYFIPFSVMFFVLFLIMIFAVMFIAVTASGMFMPLMEL